jgi:hypothetical protein
MRKAKTRRTPAEMLDDREAIHRAVAEATREAARASKARTTAPRRRTTTSRRRRAA